MTGAEVEKLSLPPVFMRNINLRGVAVGSRELFENMTRAISRHQVRPVIDHTFEGLEAFPDALRRLSTGSHFGKIAMELGK